MEERRMLWASMDKGNGKIEIRPMQGEAIVLHGPEEAKMFCEFVMSHYTKKMWKIAGIPHEGYVAALNIAGEMLAAHHKLKAMELEEEPGLFTKFEAIVRTVTSILSQNDKGRVEIEYDPEDDRVKFYELLPEEETEQPGGNSMTEERGRSESK